MTQIYLTRMERSDLSLRNMPRVFLIVDEWIDTNPSDHKEKKNLIK